MLIQVNYADNRFDYVKDGLLEHLINSKKIKRFRRTSGWVSVGIDPLRKSRRSFNQDPTNETRSIIQVEYSDNRYDFITGRMLDSLLDSDKITKFKRTSGWVTVGVDDTRRARREYTNSNPIELKKRA